MADAYPPHRAGTPRVAGYGLATASEAVAIPAGEASGAGHLFEAPGALDEVARLAGAWFASRLRAG